MPAPEAEPAPRLSIVVLPFANLSNDPEQEYFADGITDDLTTDLSRLARSFVIARNTAFTFKGKPTDAKQIGRDLGVRYVVEGTVRRTGDQVQVNVQLIDAESGAHLWAERFDTDRRELANAQDDITFRLARTLNVKLVAAEVALSTLLLVGTGLLFHTLWNLGKARLGFETANVTTFTAMPADAAGFSAMAVSEVPR